MIKNTSMLILAIALLTLTISITGYLKEPEAKEKIEISEEKPSVVEFECPVYTRTGMVL